MSIRFTRHARKRMLQRKISDEMVELVLTALDEVRMGTGEEELVAIKQLGTREVRVIYEEDETRGLTIVFTVIAISRRQKE